MMLPDWNKRMSEVVSRGRERERENRAELKLRIKTKDEKKKKEKKEGKRVTSRGRPSRGVVPLGNVLTDLSKSVNLNFSSLLQLIP